MSLTGIHPLWDKILSQNLQAVADQGCHLEGSSLNKGTAYREFTVLWEGSHQLQLYRCVLVGFLQLGLCRLALPLTAEVTEAIDQTIHLRTTYTYSPGSLCVLMLYQPTILKSGS
jgi:hypothetical protein